MKLRHFTKPLLLRPKFSRQMAIFTGLTHVFALISVSTLSLEEWKLKILLLLMIGCSGFWIAITKIWLRAPWSILEAYWRPDGTWRVTLGSMITYEASLVLPAFVSVHLVVLKFRLGFWRRCALPLCADSLDPETFRRLRQRLNITSGETIIQQD